MMVFTLNFLVGMVYGVWCMVYGGGDVGQDGGILKEQVGIG